MARHDIAKLKDLVPLERLVGEVVPLTENGPEWQACCPFHMEKTPSFTVFRGERGDKFECFGCGAKGDHLDFLQQYYQIDKKAAIDRLAEYAGGDALIANDNAPQRPARERSKAPRDWTFAIAPKNEPAPTSLRVKKDDTWIDMPVVAAWPYRDTEGNLHSYACRIEFKNPDGSTGKDVIPVTWKVNTKTGEAKWRQGALPAPRILYGSELLATDPEANIILAEGEKATDAARRILSNIPALKLSWAGGCKAVDKSDWSLLKGRKVVGWPDCDSQRYADNHPKAGQLKPYHEQPGMAAMLRIAQILESHGATMRIVAVPMPGGEWSNGHDLADLEAEGWTPDQVMAFMRENLRTPAEILEMSKNPTPATPPSLPEPPPPIPANDNEPPPYDDYDQYGGEPEVSHHSYSQRPFRVLGWDRGRAYYLPDGMPQVTALVPSAHTKLNLLQLAPISYWESDFPSSKRSGDKVNWEMAADALMQQAQRMGIWDPELIRGRGAWWDRGKWAVHLGNRVVIGNAGGEPAEYDLRTAPTDYVYEASKPINLAFDDPLTNSDSVKLVQICERLRWERPISGKLLAGWVFLAPICGALMWRPHLWITGGAGSGKTTVMVDIIGRCLEGIALKVEGDTSEAGIRQALLHDARPVVFDEFESERRKAAERVEDVLAMVTRASSETGADLLKGGADGRAATFKTRAMFAFASIAVTLKQHAARTRVTVMSLFSQPETPESLAEFNSMMEYLYDTLTEDYIQRLQARAVRMIPIIRKNARVFAEAAAIELKDRRMGDQIGTLLAGAYGLHSTGPISREKAVEWIKKQNWDEVAEVAEGRDEQACLRHILAYVVKVDTFQHGTKSRSVGELIGRAANMTSDYELTNDDAYGALLRLGIWVTKRSDDVWVARLANSHRELKRILADTSWSESYSRTLQRLPGSSKLEPRKFGGSGTYRSTELVLDQILN